MQQPTTPTTSNKMEKCPIQIGITGGIGSGKSIVSHILRLMQYPVYDTDSAAKRIMDSATMRCAITQEWGNEIYNDQGELQRARLAAIVFAQPTELAKLNALVHPAVRHDYAEWVKQQTSPIVFVESAILHEAKMAQSLDYIWFVDADTETRIARVCRRNNLSRSDVEARIASQKKTPVTPCTRLIINDDHTAVLPQMTKWLKEANGSK